MVIRFDSSLSKGSLLRDAWWHAIQTKSSTLLVFDFKGVDMRYFVLYNRDSDQFFGSSFFFHMPKLFPTMEKVKAELEKIKRKNESARTAAKAVKSGHTPRVFSYEDWEILEVSEEGIQHVS